MKIKKLKSNKGISMADIAIAITVLCLFVGVIGTLYYKILYQSHIIRYNAVAVYYTVKVAEETDRISYEEVTNDLTNTLKQNFNIPDSINITVNVQNYNDTDASKKDIIKIVTIKAEYEVLNNPQSYEIKKLKIKEM